MHGDVLAVIDESSPLAGSGIYYVVAAAVIFDWQTVRRDVAGVIGGRASPFHYRNEGPNAIKRMADLLEASGVLGTVLWRPVGRRGQVAARRDLLAVHARRLAAEGISHLVIESGDQHTNQRDQETLLAAFEADGGVPFRYDWRSKAEPLLWIADAICGITAEHLLGRANSAYDRLAAAGVIEVDNR